MILHTFDKEFYYERSEGEFIMPSRHYHTLFEIYFLEKGSGSYFIDNKSYEIHSGDIVFIPPGTLHKTLYKDNTRIRHVINCPGHFLPDSVTEVISEISPIYRNPETVSLVKEYLFKIEQEYKADNQFSKDTIKCYLQLMLICLAKHKNTRVFITSQNDLISDIAEFMKNNISYSLTLCETAKKYAVTPQYLSMLFKKKTGIGFHEYIHLLRMLKAEELLISNPKISISEVSERCGFNDSNYFSFIFKKHFGITPSEMKKQKSK